MWLHSTAYQKVPMTCAVHFLHQPDLSFPPPLEASNNIQLVPVIPLKKGQ